MPDANRAMFWRIIRRLLGANRGRLFVMLLALGAGAAVTAALLNLQVDAKRRLTTEFRAFGANVIVAPRNTQESTRVSATLDESVLRVVQVKPQGKNFFGIPFLYLTAKISSQDATSGLQAVVAGTSLDMIAWTEPGMKAVGGGGPTSLERACYVGVNLAKKLQIQTGSVAQLASNEMATECAVGGVLSSGGPADNQIFVPLDVAQRLAGLPSRLSLVQVVVTGTPQEVANRISDLAKELPETEVRPIRQFTEGEAKIYNRISGLLTATVGIVLLLTALCVMAAMTNVAMERKMDVGLMKAIGGATRRVVRLFLAEAALLGLAGGLVGAAAGIFLSIGLGKAVFGVAARPRLIVYPVAVALTVLVAILSAFPLRRLASLRPASVFRGEA
ncbi:MAG TPA: ABC transporter permease [Candidatus Angelobacter sp.]|nr:ABC transporter permease [Candidatus Angelobacter sp.]